MRVRELEYGHSDLNLSRTLHGARLGYGPHSATDAAKRRLTQKVCRSRFPGLSCTHKRPRCCRGLHLLVLEKSYNLGHFEPCEGVL